MKTTLCPVQKEVVAVLISTEGVQEAGAVPVRQMPKVAVDRAVETLNTLI